MADQEYWIVRHGERYDFKHPFLYNFFNAGILKSDTWITDWGKKEALVLGGQITKATYNIPQVIVCSPYLRCLQTAQALSQVFQDAGHTVPMVIDTRLSEFQPLIAERTYMYPDGIPGFTGLESPSQMVKRCDDVATSIRAKYKNAIIVSHASIVYHMSLSMLSKDVAASYTSDFLRANQVPYVGYAHIANKLTVGSPLALIDTNISNFGQ